MSLSTKNNVASLRLLQGELSRAKGRIQRSFRRLSSGFQVNRGGVSSLELSQELQARIRQFSAAERATDRAILVAKAVEEGLLEIGHVVLQMHGLAEHGLQDVLTALDRQPLDDEFQHLKSEIARLGQETAMNDSALLHSGASIDFTVQEPRKAHDELAFEFASGALTYLGLAEASVAGQDNRAAKESVLLLDHAAADVDKRRAEAERRVRRLRGVLLGSRAIRNNLESANSRPVDVDRAEERSVLARSQVLLESGIAVLAQGKRGSAMALTLLH